MKKLLIPIALVLTAALILTDPFHASVEKIDELIGHNLDHASKAYFRSDPDEQYSIRINQPLSEFHGGILNSPYPIRDSIVFVYTWHSWNHKSTIWVADTGGTSDLIVDALRYKNDVRF